MTPLSEADLLGRRVLVADAEAPARWLYVGLLRDAGARVTEARDGVEALKLARSQRPDLILADVSMPRLDGLGLCAALREEPSLAGVTVILLSDGEPPQAVLGADAESGALVDAVIAALEHREAAPPPGPREPSETELKERAIEPDSGPVVSLVERENVRAQSTVAMHREPANRAPRAGPHAVWRLRRSAAPKGDGSTSGFGMELQVMSRILGIGFIALLAGTVGLLLWRLVVPVGAPKAPVSAVEPSQDSPVIASAEPEASERAGLAGYSGELRPGVDPSVGVAEGQGALDVTGPAHVVVSVDGFDHGPLPVSLPLDEGVHVVRYRFEDSFSDRFYYVKAGATRVLRVITRPGGFVDAR